MSEIIINVKNVQKAYNAARSSEAKELLINLFGKENIEPEQPKNIMKRIKTFEDACNELGDENPLVLQYQCIINNNSEWHEKELIAYHKLRIIAAALNEGWKPEFTEDEHRYYPYYYFYTQEEYDNLSDEEKEYSRAIGRASYHANAFGGLVYVSVDYVSSYTYAFYASHLAFKNRELAEYAGKQFIDIYADFVGVF